MAQYTVEHACGHTVVHSIYGPTKDRQPKADWLGERDCSECRASKRDAANDAANETAAEANRLRGAVELTGSEKQVAWAETIRKPVLELVDAVEAGYKVKLVDWDRLSDAAKEELLDGLALVLDEIAGQTSAAWWIDKRGWIQYDFCDLPRALAYVHKSIHERKLAPTAAPELTALAAVRIEARNRADAMVDEALASLPVTEETATIVEGKTSYTMWRVGRIEYGDVVVDMPENHNHGTAVVSKSGVKIGAVELHRTDGRPAAAKLVDSVAALLRRDADRRRRDEIRAAGDSLAGVQVASATKTAARTQHNLDVKLSDGRRLSCLTTKDGIEEAKVIDGRDGCWVECGHPDVVRIVTAALAVAVKVKASK